MSDEEKSIEEKYNSILNNAKANWIYEDYEILLNFQDLYKQQQKEIEKLKKEIEIFGKHKKVINEYMPKDTELILMCKSDFDRNFGNDYISKDKIREKIKNIEDSLEELLEE